MAVIAVAAAVAYFAPAIAAAILPATATAAATAAVTAAVAATLTAAVSLAFAALAGRPSALGAGTPGIIRQALGNSYLVYGKRRVGGLLIFFHPRGKDFRYFVIAVAGHSCKGVVRWFLGDEEVTVDGAGKVTSGPYANNAWLWFYRGTDDQVAHPTFVAETDGKWTAAHRGRGTALIYAKFKMTDDVVQAGMPNITAEIEGKDDIVDLRTDTAGYTRNAQLVYRDWMALPREEGGFGAYPDELDDDWDAAQANVCDEPVSLAAGGTEDRYAFDCYITTGAAPSEVRDTFVTCCAGSFTYSGGKFLLRPGYYVPPSRTLSEADLAGPIRVPALREGDEVATEVTGTFISPADMYQPRDVPTRAIGGGLDVRQISVDLPHVTSVTMGQRVLEIRLRKSQAERRVTWPMNIMGIAVSTLDTVQLGTARYGLSNYAFQVTGWGLAQDFGVVLGLEETGPEIFDWNVSMELEIGETPMLDRADPIGDARGAYTIRSSTPAYRLTSDDVSVGVVAFDGVLDDGRAMSFAAATLPATASTEYAVFFDLEAGTYELTNQGPSAQLQSARYVWIGDIATLNALGEAPPSETPPPGGGGYGPRNPIP